MESHTVNGKKSEKGYLMMGLLIYMVLMGFTFTIYSQVWSTVTKRENEAELLFRLKQIRSGIVKYKIKKGYLPSTLDELYKGRFIRRKFEDPFTGNFDWKVETKDGGIIDIKSSSKQKSLGKEAYSKW